MRPSLSRLPFEAYRVRALPSHLLSFALPQLSVRLEAALEPLQILSQQSRSHSAATRLKRVAALYSRTSQRLLQQGIPEDELHQELRRVRGEHVNVQSDIAESALPQNCSLYQDEMQRGLRDFLKLRVGFYTLLTHCIASESEEPGRTGAVGELDLRHVLEVAAQDAATLCVRVYGTVSVPDLLCADNSRNPGARGANSW